MTIRVLIVDDFGEWRRQVRLLLQARPEWQVIAEALDGSEAVQKAEELKPDVILLDIALPILNGIEAARRIQQRSPDSKIILMSADNSPDIVKEVLSTGAQGYVYKANAQSELLLAIDAVLQGKRFLTKPLRNLQYPDG